MAQITEYNFSPEEIQLILVNHVRNTFHESNVDVQFAVTLELNQSDNTLLIKVKATAKCLN